MIDRSMSEKANFLPFRKRHITIQQHQEEPPRQEQVHTHTEVQNGTSFAVREPLSPNGHSSLTTKQPKTVSLKDEEYTATIMSSMIMMNNNNTATSPSRKSTDTTPTTQSKSQHVQNGPAKIKTDSSNMSNGKSARPIRPGPSKQHNMPPKKKAKIEEEEEATDSSDDEEDDGKIYCICRQPYNPNLWMIACDVCNDWYHGKCVQITAMQARKIKVYVCPTCSQRTGKDIQYKTPKKRKLNENDSRSNSPTHSPNSTHDGELIHGNTTDASNEATDSSTTTDTRNTNGDRPIKRKKVVTDDDDDDDKELKRSVKCVCSSKEEKGKMISCDNCKCILHLDCLRMSDAPDHYLCPPCKKSETRPSKITRPREDWAAFMINVAMNNEGNTTDTSISHSEVKSESGPYHPKKMSYYFQQKQMNAETAPSPTAITSQQNA